MRQQNFLSPEIHLCITCQRDVRSLGGAWRRDAGQFECYQCAGVVPTGLEAVLRAPVARDTTPTPHRRPCAKVVVGYARVRNAHLLTNRDSGSKMGMSRQGYHASCRVAPSAPISYNTSPAPTVQLVALSRQRTTNAVGVWHLRGL